MNEEKCAETVFPYRGPSYRCQRRATVERDGKRYCWQHDPERVRADREQRHARWDAKADMQRRAYARRIAMARVCRGISTEDLNKLEGGAVQRLLNTG